MPISCSYLPCDLPGEADLQGHLETIYSMLIVSDGRGAEESRRGSLTTRLSLTSKQPNLFPQNVMILSRKWLNLLYSKTPDKQKFLFGPLSS